MKVQLQCYAAGLEATTFTLSVQWKSCIFLELFQFWSQICSGQADNRVVYLFALYSPTETCMVAKATTGVGQGLGQYSYREGWVVSQVGKIELNVFLTTLSIGKNKNLSKSCAQLHVNTWPSSCPQEDQATINNNILSSRGSQVFRIWIWSGICAH